MLEMNDVSNPFPGLRPFETDENNLFFGRDGQSDELLERLRRSRFLAVVGTSGSGKSSLIRAGLLPALFGGLMGDAGSGWRIAIQRPGGDPIGNLAQALSDKSVFGAETNSEIQKTLIETTLRRSSIGLIDVTRQARMDSHENLLVVVDQFEELFRFKQIQSGDDATAFVKLLLEAGTQSELPIYIVLTMRSDFLGDCSQFSGLPEAINNGQYLIPRMSRDERRSAIVGPVAVGSAEITPPLVNRLLNDVGDNPDQLPILQHALMRTWDYWDSHKLNGEPIGLEHYTAIGTMAEALSRHADEAFNELPDERSRLIAEKLFKRLTEKGTDNREIRRPTRLAELCAVCEATDAEVKAVIDVFRRQGRSFLMPPIGVHLEPDTVIDISHESLIRNWQRLQTWVNEEAQSARTYRRLAEAAALHHEGSEALLQDPALQIALDWLANSKPNPEWGQRYHPEYDQALKYLADSRLAREAAQLERERQRSAELERARREREQAEMYAAGQAQAAKRLRSYLVGMVVLAVMALGAAGVAGVALVKAKRNQQNAEEERFKAEKATRRETESLRAETYAKTEAQEQKQKAEEEKRIADTQKGIAENQKALADERAADAERARKSAVAAEEAALRARDAFEREAKKNEQAKKANDMFREGALNVQRGKYQNAKDYFSSAIEEFQDPIIANDEGVADATVEIGNLALAVGRQTFARNRNFRIGNVMGNLDLGTGKYDEAAKLYAGPTVNALDKAAATNFSLAMSLLPFGNGTIVRSAPDQGAGSLAGWNGAEGELPELGIGPRSSGPLGYSNFTYDPVTKIKNATVKHLRVALAQYKQVYEEHKNNTDDWRTEVAREGMRKAAYQLGDFFVKQANEEATNRAYKNDADRQKAVTYTRREAVAYFNELLSTYPVDDIARGQVLIWLAGLHLDLGNSENGADDKRKAEEYLNRALAAHRQAFYSMNNSDALNMIASILNANDQPSAALELYRRAKESYQREKDAWHQAEMAFAIARILERQNRLDPAIDSYIEALAGYKADHEQKKTTRTQTFTSPRPLLEIARFFKGIGGDDGFGVALQALNLAVDCREECKFYQGDLAHAYSEKGSILALQNRSREALEAYRQAASAYEAVSQNESYTNTTRQEAAIDLERVKTIIKALENGLNASPKK
jgi:tetratricopeptide (TPR) repeat protein